jgi:transposase
MEFLEDIQWPKGQAIDIKERDLIVHLLGAGMTPKDISLALTRDKRTVNKWIKRWQQTGELNIKKSTGRPRDDTRRLKYMFARHSQPIHITSGNKNSMQT